MFEERDQILEPDPLGSLPVGPLLGRCRCIVGACLDRAGGAELDGIERPGADHTQLIGGEVGLAERLERVSRRQLLACFITDHLGQRVAQLGDWNAWWELGVRHLVTTGIGDDQGLPGRHHGVEEQLAVFSAATRVADDLVAKHQVVAIRTAGPWETGLVHAQQTHNPVRHRTHRGERADGDVTGAEMERARAVVGPAADHRPGLSEGDDRIHLIGGRFGNHERVGKQTLELVELPLVTPRRRSEQLDRRRDDLGPLRHRSFVVEQHSRSSKTVNDVGEDPSDCGVVPFDSLHGCGGLHHAHLIVGVEDAAQDPIEAPPPGAFVIDSGTP